MATHTRMFSCGLAMLLAAAMAACGGSSDDTGSPTPPGGGGGGGGGNTGPIAATITITASGVSPKNVTVAAGSRVMFVNNDSRAHVMASDPHPVHTDCPSIELVGFLSASQSRATGDLNNQRTCGFHDHSLPEDTSLQGTITVQ